MRFVPTSTTCMAEACDGNGRAATARCRHTMGKTFRLIPSRYPPIDLFERIADPEDWEVLAHIEGLTNDRLREEIGDNVGKTKPT